MLTEKEICNIEGCTNKCYNKHICRKHHQEKKRKETEYNWNCYNWNRYVRGIGTSSYERPFFKKDDMIWREKVLERDGYTCQNCGFIGLFNINLNVRGICAHHMNNWLQYPKDRFNTDNGITLCEDCHKKIHKGRGRSTLKNNLEFFNLNILDVIENNKKINSFKMVQFRILGEVSYPYKNFEDYCNQNKGGLLGNFSES